jgi:D-alanine transfer protein
VEVLPAKTSNPHLFAAAVTLALTTAILLAGRAIAVHFERSTVGAIAPEVFPLKTQGLAFQRAAAQARDVLPLYGSSEMLAPAGARAGDFFATAPTGFQVSPVGKPGATSLIILQKIGALDRELRDQKVAISLSSVWFLGTPTSYWYDGNFSRFAASRLIFNSALDFGLKRDIASRMIQYPSTLEKTPLLDFALKRLASGRWFDEVLFCAVWPLGKIEDAILDLQDHFAALSVLRGHKPAPSRRPQTLEWPTLIAKAEESTAARLKVNQSATEPRRHVAVGSRDEWFRAHMNESTEWTDLELLLRTLKEIHAHPLLLSMPMNGPYFEKSGISRSALEDYHKKIQAVAQRYNFELVDFADHDDDPNFLNPHLTAKGWILFDRVIDDFMHERFPRT